MVKPCVVGTTARASKPNVRTIGYSIYYTMVNIGGAAGPLVASWTHRHLGVEKVYRVSALSVFAMFFLVLLFFREPRKAGDAPPPSIATVAKNFCVVVGNYRLVLPVLLIALLLRIGLWVHPGFGVPWWVWVGLLVLVLAGISKFMWFLVIFTGILGCVLAGVRQFARIPSSVRQCPSRRGENSGDGRDHGDLSDHGG